MIIEHENAPEGLEYYKTMDRWNKRKIEQLEEENKRLREEVERLKKEKRNNHREEELKKELEKVKFENGNFVQGARTNKEIKAKNNKDKNQEILELQKRNQELNDVIAQQNQSIEAQNETIVELNMIRMEPYMEIISTMEPI